jgi:hypothetical protein
MSTANGTFFVNDILQRIGSAKIVLAVLSPDYFKSQFCVAEVGASQLLHQVQKSAEFYSLLAPPANYNTSLQGVLAGVQSGRIDDSQAFGEIRDRVIQHVPNPPPIPIWDTKRDAFLAAARPIIEKMEAVALLNKLIISKALFVQDSDPKITYKLKLRVELRNDTGKAVKVKGVRWVSGVHGAKLQKPLPSSSTLQLFAGTTWQKEASGITVPSGDTFRLWIGIDPAEGLRILNQNDRLGSLQMTVSISGHEIDWTKEI